MEKGRIEKVYCKNCVYCIRDLRSFPPSIIEQGRPVCGFHLETYLDPIGEEKYKEYDKEETCSKCGSILHDDRRLVCKFCDHVNKKYDCKHYEEIKVKYSFIGFIKKLIRRK